MIYLIMKDLGVDQMDVHMKLSNLVIILMKYWI